MAANASGIRAGRAFVEIGTNNNPLYAGLKAAETRIRAWGASIQNVGAKINALGAGVAGLGQSLVRIGSAAAVPFVLAIRSAGDMAETVSKLEAVFKDDSMAVKTWAKSYSEAVGRSQKQVMTFLADTGSILSSFGFNAQQTKELSQTITQLATDLASFNNMRDTDALAALISGIGGESEPLKRFGVLLNETILNAELLAKGLDPEIATAEQKALARLEFVIKRTSNAQGDAIKTAGSFNNQMKALEGKISDLSVMIGEQLIPVATQMVQWAKNGIGIIARFAKENSGMARTIATAAIAVAGIGAVLITLSVAIKAVGFSLAGVGAAFNVVAGIIGVMTNPIGLVIAALVAGTLAMQGFSGAGAQALQWIGENFGWLGEVATTTFKAISDALAAGDLAKAGQILWATLKVTFLAGVAELNKIWIDWSTATKQVFADISTALASIMIDTWATIRKIWADAINSLLGSWGSMIGSMVKAINPLGDILLKVFGIDVKKAVDNLDWVLNLGPGSAELQKRQAAQMAGIEADRQTSQSQLQFQAANDFASRQAAAEQGLTGPQSALEKARAELDAAISGTTTGTGAGASAGPSYTPPVPGAPKLPAMVGDIANVAAERAARTTETKGTFSATAIRSLSSGDSVIDAVKEGNKETKKQTGEIVKMRRSVEQAGRLE